MEEQALWFTGGVNWKKGVEVGRSDLVVWAWLKGLLTVYLMAVIEWLIWWVENGIMVMIPPEKRGNVFGVLGGTIIIEEGERQWWSNKVQVYDGFSDWIV